MSSKEKWIQKCFSWKEKWPPYNASFKDDVNGINLYFFIEKINEYSTSDHTIVCDAGSSIYASCQNLRIKNKQKFILSGAQADMGFSVPASIGVSLADRAKKVIVFTGDGSFNTNIQELATIRGLNLPIIIFVWNNNGYLSIKNTQRRFYEGRVYGTDSKTGVWFPALKNIAISYEMGYYKISNNKELEDNIGDILSKTEPTICEIMCQENQQIVPNLTMKVDPITNKSIQCGLNDMAPFLSEDELKKEMDFDYEKNNI